MSSNAGRSVRLRPERRPSLDVERFARAILALSALLKLQAESYNPPANPSTGEPTEAEP